MATMNVLDAAGATVAVEKPLAPGRAAAASSRPVALSTEDAAYLDGIETLIGTTNTTLTTIDGRVDGLEAASGAIADAAWASGNGSQIALLKAIAGAALDTTTASPIKPGAREHETVAASQTDQMCGASGAAGDILDGLLIIPATTSPGAVSIEYGSTNITVFAGGASSVGDLRPFWIELGSIASVGGGWEITTGSSVSVIAVGDFT